MQSRARKQLTKATLSRRQFLGTALSAGLTTNIFTGRLRGANDRITVGFIGCGIRGYQGLIPMFLRVEECQCVATCDPFEERRFRAAARIDSYYASVSGKATYKTCASYADFRDLLARSDIDAVAIATPDHWHVLIAVAAVRSSKDVYVEKPLAVALNHAKVLRKELQRTGRIFQYGTQQRSMEHVRRGCELVRNGRIGQVHTVVVLAPSGERGGSTEPMPVPPGFDYEMWTGPAPMRPYNDDRCLQPGHYHIYDYSLGFIAGWGAHPLDVAQWGLGTDDTSPVEYEGRGFIPRKGLYDAIANWTVRARYANGIVMHFMDDHTNLTKFIGTEGWVAISRQSLDAEPKSLLTSPIRADELHLPVSTSHAQNFIEAVKTRQQPVSPFEAAIRSDTISHLSNIAIRLGRGVRWDPQREQILDDEEAAQMLDRPIRPPWSVEIMVSKA